MDNRKFLNRNPDRMRQAFLGDFTVLDGALLAISTQHQPGATDTVAWWGRFEEGFVNREVLERRLTIH